MLVYGLEVIFSAAELVTNRHASFLGQHCGYYAPLAGVFVSVT